MSDPKLEICPQCGGKIERLIGPGAGIVFKGSGFYQTDYRSQDYQKKAKSEAGKSSPPKPAEGQSAYAAAPLAVGPQCIPRFLLLWRHEEDGTTCSAALIVAFAVRAGPAGEEVVVGEVQVAA